MQKNLFSVIIPTYNRSGTLSRCLEALSAQDFPFDKFEVIVCDDGSSDDTAAAVTRFKASLTLKYIRQDNKGPAAARNLGILNSIGKYLLFLNDDAIAADNLLTNHSRFLKDEEK
ncbi:glycosyl transferase family 2 protein, partial [Candidatus Magnetoovum chiemensis]